ncbi:MAG: RNA methyltransferase [Chlamydiae bacterium]|nr:RNA methyltransferase [Chlamydiota bacterium]
MKQMLEITSLQNPKMKNAVRLFDRKARDESGLFLIEGYRELSRAVDASIEIVSLFICPTLFLGENEQSLIDKALKGGADIFSCDPKVFKKLSYRDRPDGLIAVASQMKLSLDALSRKIQGKQNPFFLVAESIEKPGNLGTILRSCDAVGADGVIICDRCTDIYNPNVVRASVGTLFTVPVVEAEGSQVLSWLKSRGVKILSSTPNTEVEYTEADLSGPVALVVGTEQLGLSEAWLSQADVKVRIPMMGVADSLNVATATTLLLYEVLRQRSSTR